METPGLPEVFLPGPDNPLGSHALNLSWQGILIHGTNHPFSIGQYSSHGCIRLYPENIPVLFKLVEVGTKISVINEDYKVGWQDNKLWLEVNPGRYDRNVSQKLIGEVNKAVTENAGRRAKIDWSLVKKVTKERKGIPIIIGHRKHKFD